MNITTTRRSEGPLKEPSIKWQMTQHDMTVQLGTGPNASATVRCVRPHEYTNYEAQTENHTPSTLNPSVVSRTDDRTRTKPVRSEDPVCSQKMRKIVECGYSVEKCIFIQHGSISHLSGLDQLRTKRKIRDTKKSHSDCGFCPFDY